MDDVRPILERARANFPRVEDQLSLDGVIDRRKHKLRNQRLAVVVVGLSVTVALAAGAVTILRSTPDRPGISHTTLPVILRPGEVLRIAHPNPRRIYAFDTATGRKRTISRCEEPCIFFNRYALSPDGRWLATERWTCLGALPCESEAGLWVTNALGQERQLTHPCQPDGCVREAWSWTSDGALLLVGEGTSTVAIDPFDGSRVTLGTTSGPVAAVAGSPDGSRVAFADEQALWIADTSGSDGSTRIADLGGSPNSIAWSPDGDRLVLDIIEDGRDRLYVASADGSSMARIVDQDSPEGPGAPAWSPDGGRIAYATTPRPHQGFTFEVWTIGPDGSEPVRVAHFPCCVDDWQGPVWSPDGARVAFGFNYDWYVAQADGSGDRHRISPATVARWR